MGAGASLTDSIYSKSAKEEDERGNRMEEERTKGRIRQRERKKRGLIAIELGGDGREKDCEGRGGWPSSPSLDE